MAFNLHICLIPGLGAGPEVFDRLDTGSLPRTYVKWIEPRKGESLSGYSNRLAAQLPNNCDLILIGVSFGGMIALEMAALLPVRHVFLISSMAHPRELPVLYRLLGKLGMDKLLPVSWLLAMRPLLFFLFGVRRKADKELLVAMMKHTDGAFIKWAMRSILRWEPTACRVPVTRCHGTRDRLLSPPNASQSVLIGGGGHLIIRTHARQISKIIMELIEKHR